MSGNDIPAEEPTPSEEPAVEVEAEVVDATEARTEEEAPNDGQPRAEWKYKTQFGIVEEMQRAIHLTVAACQSELVVLRRKMNKLTYGGGK